MKGFWGLVSLELKRHDFWKISASRQSFLTWSGIWLTLLAIGLWGFSRFDSFPVIMFVYAILFIAAMIAIPWGVELVTSMSPYREWWLTFPHRRITLVLSKWMANILLGVRVWCTMGSVLLVIGLIEMLQNGTDVLADSTYGSWGVLAILATLAGVPVCVGISMLALLFSTGLWRAGHMLFGGVVGGMTASAGYLIAGDKTRLFTGPMLHTILTYLMLVGWPAAGVCILLGTLGVGRMAIVRPKMDGMGEGARTRTEASGPPVEFGKIAVTATEKVMSTRDIQPRVSSLRALFLLEYRRFMIFGKHAPVLWRRLALTIIVLLFLVGFIVSFWQEPTVAIPAFWIDVSQMIVPFTVTQLIIGDLMKGYGVWWLSFPHSRAKLLATRSAAPLSVMFLYGMIGLLCLGSGVAVHALVFHADWHLYSIAWSYVWRTIAVVVVLNPLLTALGFVSSTLFRGFKSILLIPIYFVGYGGVNWFVTMLLFSKDSIMDGPQPAFMVHLLSTAIIGIPIAVLCFVIGSRNVYRFMFARNWKLGVWR